MSRRLYFLLPDIVTCSAVVTELRAEGIRERHMHSISSLVGQDIEGLPKSGLLEKTEFVHGIEAGIGVGGIAGLLGGLLTVTFPPAGLALGGGAVLATALAGAGFGALVSGLVARDMPNHAVEQFEREIAAGQILLMVDVPYKQMHFFIDLIKSHHPHAIIGISERPN